MGQRVKLKKDRSKVKGVAIRRRMNAPKKKTKGKRA